MSLEHGILGFLAMKPMSGYDIKKLFDISASYFWPADLTQIYRTLKKLSKDGLVELSECKKGVTVDRKVYAITGKGQEAYLKSIGDNSLSDFISRDAFLMQLFFSGALSREEQLRFLDTQLRNVNALTRQLIENYNANITRFTGMTGLNGDDRRIHSAVYAHRWGLAKCREYGKLLTKMKKEIHRTPEQSAGKAKERPTEGI